MKRLLILASKLGYQTRGFAEAAEKLGVEVVFGTDRCHKLDDPWGDSAHPLHFEAPQDAAIEIAAQLRGEPPDAIIALGDRATPAAAYAARAFGIVGNPPEAVEACRNKLRQRRVLSAAKVLVPEFFSFAPSDKMEHVLGRVQYPCVVKPLIAGGQPGSDSREQRGRIRVRSEANSIPAKFSRDSGAARAGHGRAACRKIYSGKGSGSRRSAGDWEIARAGNF